MAISLTYEKGESHKDSPLNYNSNFNMSCGLQKLNLGLWVEFRMQPFVCETL